jgi:aconitase A
MAPLEQLGFALAGFGCTTCIGNSGPLDESISRAIDENDLVVAAVLSGNRNFEGRIHPLARASYLASPPLVVAFAIAGRVDIDLTTEPLGLDRDGRPVMLDELWPGSDDIRSVISASIDHSYGARRGHHEVMMRGTFGNVRLRNRLIDGKEGPYTVHLPDGEEQFIYDAAMRYRDEGVPLVVLVGREYGSGSSRDWAAKGTSLLGIRAVIAESYERIHRSNLVGMGVLPLEFLPGETPASIGLTGLESHSIKGIATGLAPRCRLTVVARGVDGHERQFEVVTRLDGPIDVDYFRQGGILPAVLRGLSAEH